MAICGICLIPAWALGSSAGSLPAEMQMTHRMMLLVIQLGLILFAAKLGNILFEKVKLPGTLGEISAGMLIGPYALGQFGFFGFPDGLFPIVGGGVLAVSPELYGLAAVAAVVLMFNVGLQTDLKLLLRFAVAGGLVGLGGLLTSFFLGAYSVKVLSGILLGSRIGLFAPQCLMLGTIASATSVGITARILSSKRKTDSPEGVTILSAAVIDDVLGIVLLAVVMGVLSASRATGAIDWGHIGALATKAVGVWLGATIVGLTAARKIGFLLKWFGERTSIAVMALGLALILAGLFEEAGLAMIIGAYVMGLSLTKADITHVVRERLAPVAAFLVPVFFCVTGMQINVGAFGSGGLVLFGIGYGIAALIAKLAGCGLPALLANFNLRGAGRIGFGMAPRCEVALIIAGVALAGGFIEADMLSAVVMMVVINTLVAPPALVLLYRADKPGTRRPVPTDKAEQEVSFQFPSVEMTGFFVDKLVAVFESEGFFVHLISRSQNLYQLRKDRAIIEFRHSDTELVFSCQAEAVKLVNAAVYEALAFVEKAVKALKEPLDSEAIGRGIQQDNGPLGPQTLILTDYLKPALIEPDLPGRTKEQIIDELLDMLVRNGLVRDREAAAQAIWERENSMSTGLQYGVAIPHGKTDAVGRLVCTLGISKDGVDFGSMDGEPSRIFILTLSPKSKPAPHVQFMSAVSGLLNAEGREAILSCRNAREVFAVVSAAQNK